MSESAASGSPSERCGLSCPTPPECLPRPLTPEEREAAWRAANFRGSTSGHARPVALWILGPSAVGKSTLAGRFGVDFGIPPAPEGPGGSEGCQQLDAVTIDGEFMREAHGVWQQWVKTPDWRSAYPALKSLINKEKDSMCTEAALQRKHLIIPQTLLNLEKGLTEVEELAWQGYANHVLAVVAPLADCQRRGRCREEATGKRYAPREFELSIAAIPPMIASCNGRYQVVRALEPKGCTDGLDFCVLASGLCGSHPDATPDVAPAAAIAAAIGRAAAPPPAAAASPTGGARPGHRFVRAATLPAALSPGGLQPRPLTPEERRDAWAAANFDAASSQRRPVALWVLGPPAVGKSTLARRLALRFGIAEGGQPAGRPDAVLVDGEFMREAHPVWRAWVRSPERQSADQAMKSILNKEKDRLCTEAAVRRKHLVVGRRLLDLQKGLTEVAEFAYQGYANHVVGLVAPLGECERRALGRQETDGKRYEPHEFEQAVASIPRMMAACGGRCELLRPVELEDRERGLDFRVIASGPGGPQAVGGVLDPEAVEASVAHWQAAVEEALRQA